MYVSGIISWWQLRLQAEAPELLVGIMNSGSATVANVNDLVQFNMATEGTVLHHLNVMYWLPLCYHVYSVNFVVTCDSYLSVSKTSFQCNHLNIPVYPIQVWVYKLYTPLLNLHVWTFQAFNSPFPKAIVEQLNKTEDLYGSNKYYCERYNRIKRHM